MSSSYSLPNVKPWVVWAADDLGTRFGIKTIGGNYGGVGRYGHEDHPLGLALDFMTGSGQALADYARAHARELGISYVIWNRRIWSVARDDEGWRTYTGSNPHTDHVHVSFYNTAPTGFDPGAAHAGLSPADGAGIIGTGNAVSDDPISRVGNAIAGALAPLASVGRLADWALKASLPTNQVRMAAGIAGLFFVAAGVFALVREVRNN